MSRRCERPGCGAPATVAYGFAADRLLAWLAPLAEDEADRHAGGALCGRHADAMVPPRGWWLDDRRTDEPTLFRSPEHRPAADDRAPGHHRNDDVRRRSGRRSHELAVGEQLALDEAVVGAVGEPGPEAGADVAPPRPDESTPGGADRSGDGRSGDGPHDPPAEPWTPSFDVTDDLGGLLDASTPLLARAFGRDRRSTTREGGRD